MSTTEKKYQSVQARLTQACMRHNRPSSDVRLLAVSKTKPAAAVEEVYHLGQRSFGENYVQDGMDKVLALTHLNDIEWHFIGPLQANKSRLVAEHFHWVETVDRERIARRLSEQRPDHAPNLNILVQVNISREDQKAGILPEETQVFAQFVSSLPRLTLRGLMCIAEATHNEATLKAQFNQMHELFTALKAEHTTVDTLSMGMSSDLELAVGCGSTEIRIGTDIFGARNAAH